MATQEGHKCTKMPRFFHLRQMQNKIGLQIRTVSSLSALCAFSDLTFNDSRYIR